jgi:hypothetical protein
MTRNEAWTVRERRAQEARRYRTAFAVSVLFHLLVFFVWKTIPLPPSPLAAAGPRAGDLRAAGGGMQSVNLQVTPSRPITPPRVPVVTLEVTDPVDFDFEPEVDISLAAGEAPGWEGPPGIEGGQGRGDGGRAAEGLFRVLPPTPRGLIMPINNGKLRGRQLDVWVFVDATGRVVPDSTRLNPPTSDRAFNRRLLEEAAEWVFNPATQSGEPVASWYRYGVSIGQ